MNIIKIIVITALTFIISCSSSKESAIEKAQNASQKYFKAMRYFDQQNYTTSLRMFEEFSKEYPLNKLHKSSLQMEIMLNIVVKKYSTVDYLAGLYKQSYIFDKEGVEYADYAAIIAKVKNLKNIDVSETDAIKTDEKIKTFISIYPNSRYIATLESNEKKNNKLICESGMKIAQRYCTMSHFLAAISKYKSILNQCTKYSQKESKFVENELLNIKTSIIEGKYPECNKIS